MNLRFILLIGLVIAAAAMTVWMAMVWTAKGGPVLLAALGPVLLALYLIVRLRKRR